MHAPVETRSIWCEDVDLPALPALDSDIAVDVAIVGAGITGLTAAALLKQAGRSVAVLEAGEFGRHGTTHRTSAHVTAVLDESFAKLIGNFGREAVASMVAAARDAIDRIESFSSDLGIDCDFRRVDGYRYAESADDAQEIEDDGNAAREAGLEVELLDTLPVPFNIARAYRVPQQAQFHPVKYLAGLARFVSGGGSQVWHRTRVESVDDGQPCRLKTTGGTVTARNVVLATHTPLGVWLTLHTRLVPYVSYCMTGRSSAALPAGLYWDVADPYHYIRRVDPDDPHHLLIGGADHKTGHEKDTLSHFADLETYCRSRFDLNGIDHRWSAEWFESADGLPYIGRGPGSKHVYVATGYSGVGLTQGTAAATIISDLILERPNSCAEHVSPSRVKPIASAARVMTEAAASVKGLIVDRLKTDARAVDEVAAGEGRIVHADGQRLAVYREPGGKLHVRSAICPHMGCVLAWNNAERRWDCPCHGSLFGVDGALISGPASTPLEKKEVKASERQKT